MPKSVGGLWRKLDRALGFEIPENARAFLESQGDLAAWLTARDEDSRRQATIEARMIATVRNLQEHGLIPGGNEIDIDIGGDARWQLEDELYGPQPAPISVSQGPLELHTDSNKPSVQRVVITVDPRVSQGTLVRELKRVWPELIRREWMRQTRTPDDETIALLRFVCFEVDKNTTWRQRVNAWNRRYPQWPKDTDSNFAKAFRRAAKRLTGDMHGLEWAHNPLWNLDTSTLRTMTLNGDRRARETLGLKYAHMRAFKGVDRDKAQQVIRMLEEEDSDHG
ncbi:MAG TPA: hypothetical protein VGW38_22085 [Chloroflexota bacterium]|nr:hypothetical protein [Chloroflexota bacterium]